MLKFGPVQVAVVDKLAGGQVVGIGIGEQDYMVVEDKLVAVLVVGMGRIVVRMLLVVDRLHQVLFPFLLRS